MILSRSVAFCAALLMTAGMLGALDAQAQYNSKNYMAQGGADWEVGGVLNIQSGGELTYNGATGYNVARGTAALSGTNPTTIATGFTTIAACTANLNETTIGSSGLGTTTLTVSWSGGTLSVYGWKPTSASNPTLIASSGTDNIVWSCNGA